MGSTVLIWVKDVDEMCCRDPLDVGDDFHSLKISVGGRFQTVSNRNRDLSSLMFIHHHNGYGITHDYEPNLILGLIKCFIRHEKLHLLALLSYEIPSFIIDLNISIYKRLYYPSFCPILTRKHLVNHF